MLPIHFIWSNLNVYLFYPHIFPLLSHEGEENICRNIVLARLPAPELYLNYLEG